MGEVKQISIKYWIYYFYSDMISFKDFESSLLKIDEKHYKGINIYCIVYITIKKIDNYENIYSVNLLYLQVNHANRYIVEKNENEYLIFDSVNENKKLLKKYMNFWDGGKENDFEKDYMKIKFNSDDGFPLNKPLKFHALTIIIRSVFEEDGKLYPQVFFRWCFVWVYV